MVLTRDINSVITALNNTNAPVLGTVLNDDRSGQASGSYGYGYGYSRQYGGYYGKSKA
jgi:Mrp family chromosome partitioning ATPase